MGWGGGAVGLAWGNLVIGAGGGIWDLALDGGCRWWVRGWVAIESGVGVEGCGVCVDCRVCGSRLVVRNCK